MILFHFGRYTDSTLSFPLSPYQPETFMLNTYGLLIDYVGNYEKDKIFLLIVIKKNTENNNIHVTEIHEKNEESHQIVVICILMAPWS